MDYGVEMRAAVEEVGIKSPVEEGGMSQLAHLVFPICPADGNMHIHLCLVVLFVSPLPVRSCHKSNYFCCSDTPSPNDLVVHMHDRPLCADFCIAIGHGYSLARGSAYYTSHFPHWSIHLAR